MNEALLVLFYIYLNANNSIIQNFKNVVHRTLFSGAGEMNNMVKITIEESMLGVSSFIEDISDKLSKKIDSIARTDADVPDLLRRLRKLEDGSKSVKTEYPNSPVGLSSPSQGKRCIWD